MLSSFEAVVFKLFNVLPAGAHNVSVVRFSTVTGLAAYRVILQSRRVFLV